MTSCVYFLVFLGLVWWWVFHRSLSMLLFSTLCIMLALFSAGHLLLLYLYQLPLAQALVPRAGLFSGASRGAELAPPGSVAGDGFPGRNTCRPCFGARDGSAEGRRRGMVVVVLLCPALQMADFILPSYQQNRAVPPLFPGRVAFYFLQYLGSDAALCPDLLDGVHVPTELRPRYLAWLSPAKLPPECLARGYKPQPTAAEDYSGEVYHGVIDGLRADVSPLLADDLVLGRSPPTFLLTCEFDVLRDDGLLYRRRLLDLGVPVAWQHVGDGFHGVTNFAATRVSLTVCRVRGNGARVPTALGGHPGGVRWSPASLEARSLSGDVVMSALSRTREDKWSEPGWRIEQRYANKVLIGNWVEERLKFTREAQTASSTYRLDYQPQWESRPDVSVRRAGKQRAEGPPATRFFSHHATPASHCLVSLYDESYGRRCDSAGGGAPPARRTWHHDSLSWRPERSDHPVAER
ncbi:hypothetical protein CRUP_031361 [Coryphaenoides rupestris]|nr:hypothetical protein CRUP_031361 [Coryphaenoides rupestris]